MTWWMPSIALDIDGCKKKCSLLLGGQDLPRIQTPWEQLRAPQSSLVFTARSPVSRTKLSTTITTTWTKVHNGASRVALGVKNLPASAEDTRDVVLNPEWGRSLGEGNGNPCQYPCLENPMDRGAWWATVHRGHKESDMIEWLSTHNVYTGLVVTSFYSNSLNSINLYNHLMRQELLVLLYRWGKWSHRW